VKRLKVVSIIGVGLIGGSLGMALRKRKAASKVIGIGRNPARLKMAITLGAVDRATTDFRAGVKDAQIVVIATPAGLIPEMVKKVLPYVKEDCIITDVGSTKKVIVKKIQSFLPSGIHFVGAHPLAGAEVGGVKNARPDLFQGAYCILTPVAGTNPKALAVIKKMWQSVGAGVIEISPEQHDTILAFTSHLPHLVAVSLMGLVHRYSKKYKNFSKFIAGGFRDTTRIASSPGEIWRDIFLTNRAEILRALAGFKREIDSIESFIRTEDGDSLRKKLEFAKRQRDLLLKTR